MVLKYPAPDPVVKTVNPKKFYIVLDISYISFFVLRGTRAASCYLQCVEMQRVGKPSLAFNLVNTPCRWLYNRDSWRKMYLHHPVRIRIPYPEESQFIAQH